jgi:hypothetical protein
MAGRTQAGRKRVGLLATLAVATSGCAHGSKNLAESHLRPPQPPATGRPEGGSSTLGTDTKLAPSGKTIVPPSLGVDVL